MFIKAFVAVSLAVGALAAPPPYPIDGFVTIEPFGATDITHDEATNDLIADQFLRVSFMTSTGDRIPLGWVTIEASFPLFDKNPDNANGARIALLKELTDAQARGYQLNALGDNVRIAAASQEFAAGKPIFDRAKATLLVDSQTKRPTGLRVEANQRPTPPPVPHKAIQEAQWLMRQNLDVMIVSEIEYAVDGLVKLARNANHAASEYDVRRAVIEAENLRFRLKQHFDAQLLSATTAKENAIKDGTPDARIPGYWLNEARLADLGHAIHRLKIVSREANRYSCQAVMLYP